MVLGDSICDTTKISLIRSARSSSWNIVDCLVDDLTMKSVSVSLAKILPINILYFSIINTEIYNKLE